MLIYIAVLRCEIDCNKCIILDCVQCTCKNCKSVYYIDFHLRMFKNIHDWRLKKNPDGDIYTCLEYFDHKIKKNILIFLLFPAISTNGQRYCLHSPNMQFTLPYIQCSCAPCFPGCHPPSSQSFDIDMVYCIYIYLTFTISNVINQSK